MVALSGIARLRSLAVADPGGGGGGGGAGASNALKMWGGHCLSKHRLIQGMILGHAVSADTAVVELKY